jgi:5'-3' exonuclease
MTKAEARFDKVFCQQVERLKSEYLWTIGFTNIFQQGGYESDDLIAAICKSLDPAKQSAVIITADTDLLQCIRPHIRWYSPRSRQTMSLQAFYKQTGIYPKDWAKLKAIAGCSSDNVKGIPGVGEKTAIKYLTGQLDESHAKYKAIKRGWKKIVLRNKRLVLLPFEGTPVPKLKRDKLSQEGWNKVTRKLGMKSIRYSFKG